MKTTSSASSTESTEGAPDPVSKPVYAALGASDLIAERARQVAASATRHGSELAERARAWNNGVSVEAADVPRIAVSRALKVASQVEEAYEGLSSRGRVVADRVRDGRNASDVVRQAFATLTRQRPDSPVRPATGAVVIGETVDPIVAVVDPTPDSILDPTAESTAESVIEPTGEAVIEPTGETVIEPTGEAGHDHDGHDEGHGHEGHDEGHDHGHDHEGHGHADR